MPRIAGMPVQLYGTYGLCRTGSAGIPGNLLGRPRGRRFPAVLVNVALTPAGGEPWPGEAAVWLHSPTSTSISLSAAPHSADPWFSPFRPTSWAYGSGRSRHHRRRSSSQPGRGHARPSKRPLPSPITTGLRELEGGLEAQGALHKRGRARQRAARAGACSIWVCRRARSKLSLMHRRCARSRPPGFRTGTLRT
jgi:hypothetical protein